MIYEVYKTIYKNAVNYFLTIKPDYEISKLNKIINQQIINNKVNNLINKGLDAKQAISLLENMPKLLFLSGNYFDSHVCFIYNSDVLYATILLNNNSYEWSCYDYNNKKFLESKTQSYDAKTREITEDSMIRTLIDSTFREDIIKYARIEKEDSLETRILKLKTLKANSNGYRIK